MRYNPRMNTLVLSLALSTFAAQGVPEPSLEERRLAVIPDELSFPEKGLLTFSPDGSAVAYRAGLEEGMVVVVGDRRSATWTHADRLTWSPDGKTFAYVGNKGGTVDRFGRVEEGEFWVVVDGKPGTSHDDLFHLSLGPGGRVAYGAYDEGTKRFQVIDGKQQPAYLIVNTAVFSPDGKRVAYVALETFGKACLVVDGKPGQIYKEIFQPVFSRDGSVVACKAQTLDGKWCVVVPARRAKTSTGSAFRRSARTARSSPTPRA